MSRVKRDNKAGACSNTVVNPLELARSGVIRVSNGFHEVRACYERGARISATPNDSVHRLMTIDAATQRRLPTGTPDHLPRAQPANDVTPATTPLRAAHAGKARSECRASPNAITATASAKKAKPEPMPSAKVHHALNVSTSPDIAALVTIVASATAVGMTQMALTTNSAHAVIVDRSSVRRDPDASTTNPVAAWSESAAAAIQ